MTKRSFSVALVFPACAGVILRATVGHYTDGSFPRMRGGDPDIADYILTWGEFSPHARG